LLTGNIPQADFGRRGPTVISGKIASPKKFVVRLRRGGIMPTIWAGARGVGAVIITAQVDANQQAGALWRRAWLGKIRP
jgi:hypothetical protein